MTLTVELLGTPRAVRDGEEVTLRGHKPWLLLAYLVCAETSVPRQRLATMLFPDATDPDGALRWNLSELRRGLSIGLTGDPVELTLPEDTTVDVEVLRRGDLEQGLALDRLGRELLASVEVPDGAFEVWLDAERRHLRSLTADLLREGAHTRLGQGRVDVAAALAERTVELEPLDENNHVLLVRCLREAGRVDAARAAATAAARRLRDELGVEPSAALRSAAHATSGGTARVAGRAGVLAQLETGEAAVNAGAVDAGIDSLRAALGGARALEDPTLLARCLTSLASTLIHAVRGVDQDALALLHEAIWLAERIDDPSLVALAQREIGYVDFLRGRYQRATHWFDEARRSASGDDAALAWVETFAGAVHTDVGDPRAAAVLDRAVELSDASDDARAHAMARGMRGRQRLLEHDAEGALADLECSMEVATDAGWRSYVPWPESLRAEVSRRAGDLRGARGLLEHALATSQQVQDPCWETAALRGLGLVTVEEGRLDDGLELLRDAPQCCRRLPDTYLWVEAYSLEALARVATARQLPEAKSWVRELDELSTAHGMRSLALTAARLRIQLGEPGAEELASTRAAALTVGQPTT